MSTENRDVIFIGKKPLMAYVTSTLIQLANLPSVRIKARGLTIGRAVDVSQIISRKTENAGYSIGEIKISENYNLCQFTDIKGHSITLTGGKFQVTKLHDDTKLVLEK